MLPQGPKDIAMGERNGGHRVQSFQTGIKRVARDDIFLGAEEKAYDLSGACLNVFDHMSFFQEDTAGRIGIGRISQIFVNMRRRGRHGVVQGEVAHSFDRIG